MPLSNFFPPSAYSASSSKSEIKADVKSEVHPEEAREAQIEIRMNPLNCPQFTLLFMTGLSRSRGLTTHVATLLLAAVGFGVGGQGAIAQVSINRDANTGAVQINRNAFDLETGPLTNTSNIPLPGLLPEGTVEGRPLPSFEEDKLAPNSINITSDYDFINESFNDAATQGQADISYTLERDSLRTTTEFDLNYVPGNHSFAEGIRVTVFNADGSVKSTETVFVRGDSVTVGINGEPLPSEGSIVVDYGIDETVELRILNIRENDTVISQSGVYFTRDGQIIAEDLPNGGDRDFDDGEYLELPAGSGDANAVEEREDTEIDIETDETPLAGETRQEEVIESDEVNTTVDRDEEIVEQVVERGEVETPDTLAIRLGHAVGLRTEAGELLVYDRYASTGEVRAGSDGFTATGQLRPLFSNPSAPPTLVSGSLNFNPFVDDNEAGLGATIGVTQFLSRTHRQATDVFGNTIENPNPDGPRPLEPTGLFNNRRMVGYVPGGIRRDEPILSSEGVFDLPPDKKIVVEPSNPQSVGRGESAYTNNVGGLIIERSNGALTFVPQWTNEGHNQEDLVLEAGEATRIIYALVPQQSGQNLRLGEVYAVDKSAGGYRIADGGFTMIVADQNPDNFYQESTEVYTVEDTLPRMNNAATDSFNGIPGVYIEAPGSAPIPTVDPNIPAEADARVGNGIFPDVPGQRPYARTTRAAGFYLGGAFTAGIGNQEDIVNRVTSTFETETDQRRTVTTINTFLTPVTQVESTTVERTRLLQTEGLASFEIDRNGILRNVSFTPTSESNVVSTDSRELGSTTEVRLGEEVLSDSVTQESVETLASRTSLVEQDSSTGSNSYVNASPVDGEIALGGVFNFGNTPWTPAANLIRAELFARDTVIGQNSDGEAGWRAELIVHPFGEVQKDGYQYDESGNVVALYQTEPKLDANGEQLVEVLEATDGETVEIPVNQFVLDESGDRVVQRVGTGRPKGPGVYVRFEDTWDDDDSAVVDGGIQFSF